MWVCYVALNLADARRSGKTTVGKLYGEILSRFGLLSSGESVLENATDFIGAHIGDSEEQTRDIIREAKGKVLMIDEAHMLDPCRNRSASGPDPYRQGAIDTLVGEVQSAPGDDQCVIMCGYKEDMEVILQRANPKLARRFPIADAFMFKEFDLEQLREVLDQRMKDSFKCTMTLDAKALAMEKLSFAKKLPNFKNGGEINNLIGRAMTNYRMRFNETHLDDESGVVRFQPHDLDPPLAAAHHVEDQNDPLFEGLIGMQDVKVQFRRLVQRSTSLRAHDRRPAKFMPLHFVFSGKNHTGRKTVARILGWLYRLIGLLHTHEIIETSVQGNTWGSAPRSTLQQRSRHS